MSQSISESNRKLLANLKGGESIGIKEGQLVLIEKTKQVALDALQKAQIQNISYDFIEANIRTLTKQDTLKVIETFAKSQLLSKDQIEILQFEVAVLVRTAELLEQFEEPDAFDTMTAEAIATTELAFSDKCPISLKQKLLPELIPGGSSGSYFLKNLRGEKAGVFKPNMCEYGMPYNPTEKNRAVFESNKPKTDCQFRGHTQGTGWLNETAAFTLDDEGLIGVPDTTIISAPLLIGGKVLQLEGSFQKYINTQAKRFWELSEDDVKNSDPFEIQKLMLFDILTSNFDRTLGNVLYIEGRWIPIDHGLCFRSYPDAFNQFLIFDQLNQPIDQRLIKWILNLDIDEHCRKLKEQGMEDSAILNLRNRHEFLVKNINAKKNLYEIGKLCIKTRR